MEDKNKYGTRRQDLSSYAEKTDGRDVEYSEELADHDDKEAQARSRAADRRAKQ